MRRVENGWPRFGAEWMGLCLVPALFLLSLPVRAGELSLRLEAEAGMRNDGNFVERDAAVPAGGNFRPQSFGRGGLNLNLSYLLKRLELAMTYSPYYETGLSAGNTTAASSITHRLDFALTGNLSPRSTLHLSERLLSSPTLDLFAPTLGDTVAAPRNGRQLAQNSDAELVANVTRRASVFVGADQFVRSFAEPGLIDSRGVGARTGVRVQLDPQSEAELKLGASKYSFGLGRSADVALATTSYSHLFARGTAVRVELGGFTVSSVSAKEGAGERGVRSQGLEAVLDASRERSRWRYSANLRHGVSPGVGIGRPVMLDSLALGVSTLGRRITVGLTGSAARSQDLEGAAADRPGSGGLGAGRRLVDFVAAIADASWSFSDWGRLHGGYSRIWQSSQIASFDTVAYNRYFLGLAVAVYRTGGKPKNPTEQGGSNVQSHTP